MHETYFNEYYDLPVPKRSKMSLKFDPANLTIDEYGYSEWYKEKSSDEEELDNLPPPKSDEEK